MLGAVLKLVMFYLYQSSRPSPSQEGQPLWLERWDIPSPCATFWVTQPHPQSIHQTSDMNANTYTHTDILYFLYIYIYIYYNYKDYNIYIYILYLLYIHTHIYIQSILWFAHPQAPSPIPYSTPRYQQHQEPFLAVVVDPVRTCASGKVDIGAFRTYPAGHTPADARRHAMDAMENSGGFCRVLHGISWIIGGWR